MPATPLVDSVTAAAIAHADHCVRELLLERCPVERIAQGVRYHDCSALLNEHEYSGPTRDLHLELLRYAHARRLIETHPNAAGLVRIAPPRPVTSST